MDIDDFKNIIEDIVLRANSLKDELTNANNAPVNYACIFCQNEKELNDFTKLSLQIGAIIKETPSGSLFQIEPLNTIAGKLKLLKIRKPDITRPERGDADFTVSNYDNFKNEYLLKKGFKLIQKENFEMIELMDPKFSVRAYFSNPPLDKQLSIS